jgi:hypothetical protein
MILSIFDIKGSLDSQNIITNFNYLFLLILLLFLKIIYLKIYFYISIFY